MKLPGGLVNNSGQTLLGAGELFTTGQVLYVISVTGSDGNLGTDPNFPKATIDGAISAATADQGDIIVLLPKHAQNIANATTFQVDKAGLTIIGLGMGAQRPTFTFTNVSGSVEIDSADCRISNVVFTAGLVSIVRAINIDANGIIIDNCEFSSSSDATNFIDAIDLDTVKNVRIVNNRIVHPANPTAQEDTAKARTFIRLRNTSAVTIESNELFGNYGSATVYDYGTASANLKIIGNLIYNSSTAATTNLIDLNAASTGLLAYNDFGTLYATSANATIDPGSLLTIQNFVCNAVDEHGIIVPGTASGVGE